MMSDVQRHIAPVPQGAGLGLRRALLGPLATQLPEQISFLEVAPENWIGIGGDFGKRFRAIVERIGILDPNLDVDEEELADYFTHFYEFVMVDEVQEITPE